MPSKKPPTQSSLITKLPKMDPKFKAAAKEDIKQAVKEAHQPKILLKKAVIAFFLIAILLLLAFFLPKKLDISKIKIATQMKFADKVDDWQYGSDQESVIDRLSGVTQKIGNQIPAPQSANMAMESAPAVGGGGGGFAADESIGLAAGGAKDVNNFRQNIDNNYLPLPTDITYEGLFYDYYFDTGESYVCDQLFCPSYTSAVTRDPFSGEEEFYLSVGLNSGLKESDFQRKKLNLVVVLDISGSMSSPFTQYHYDQAGRRLSMAEASLSPTSDPEADEDATKTKMEIANKAVVALLDHLEVDDRFGMVLFDDQSYLAKPLRYVGETELDKTKEHILEINTRGGTNMAAGMAEATKLFNEFKDADQNEYENRIIFLTDAMPNMGDTSEEGLLGRTKGNAFEKVYTSFIGIGVDFNTELVEAITKIRGANYHGVHSAKEFKNRMDDEFEYMVTPLVFDLKLRFESDVYEIDQVYGSPEADQATDEIMKVNTLFPSSKQDGKTRGGLVLLKLKLKDGMGDYKLADLDFVNLSVSYQDRQGNPGGEKVTATLSEMSPEHFDNTGIRKGVLLARYVNLVKNWINDERRAGLDKPVVYYSVDMERGIVLPEPVELGQWERQSMPLKVSRHYRELFGKFKNYFVGEMAAIGDESLEQERKVLESLGG